MHMMKMDHNRKCRLIDAVGIVTLKNDVTNNFQIYTIFAMLLKMAVCSLSTYLIY